MGAVSVKAVSHFVHHDFLSVTSYLYSFSSGKSTVFLVVSQFEIERNAKDARRDATSRVCGGKRYVRLRQSRRADKGISPTSASLGSRQAPSS